MKQAHFINGQWQIGEGQPFQSIDPSDATKVWQANSATEQQVNLAIQVARQAFPNWANRPLEERLSIIEHFVELLKTHSEEVAILISRETGKPLWETRTEVAAMIGKVGISQQAYHDRSGTKETSMPGAKAVLRHRPHGVVAVFGPYNFPGHLPNGHIVPALIAGNTLVFKPSEQAPATSDKIVQLWQQAGIPDGVLNLVQGERKTGIALANHQDIDGLFFTGSPEVGHLLHQDFAGHPGKILALEMGGNNPLIVSEKVSDLNAVTHEILQSAFISTGQRCTCARRLLVPKGPLGDQVITRLVNATKAIGIDRFDADPQPFIGPLVSANAAEHVLKAFHTLLDMGATPLLEMTRGAPQTGFVTPGIVDATKIQDRLPDQEYFGPLLTVIRYDSMTQAMNVANNTRFGLSAGLLSDERDEYEYFLQHSRAGIINWNRQTTGASSAAPFGGTGASGNHRASAYYAADYCAYPVASIEVDELTVPEKLLPGLTLQTNS
ncbi:succinylglutamate-semialdehyde dehydrogenase [Marinomonas posidonica]|uniref:N-succinylglutamate 5-semialdehyde dehydrogenase n=1 Tax=Marinomonas posidonica (strain CECT 7376 / NCIMB 14433 / IVIA-Po-181) TaxID=491952 RepID=F6CZS0_MARPP|nr:succinylglutamate-semialdehyde dehydrogenase [Marinomonas posidonica]AEF53581.1 N-succinylglutamate 5-semialdehyde dehydrogenase [Marinomonas posidonica IVIA-Po-181]